MEIYMFNNAWTKIPHTSNELANKTNDLIRSKIESDQKHNSFDTIRSWTTPWDTIYSVQVAQSKKSIAFIGRHVYRRCTVYIVLQYDHSSKGTRILAFGSDKINHSGTSFGTSLDSIGLDRLIQLVTESLDRMSRIGNTPGLHTDFRLSLFTYGAADDSVKKNVFYWFLSDNKGI